MTRAPKITADKRWIGLLALVGLALGQATTMVVTAFATRDVITVLRAETGPVPVGALVAIAVAGIVIFTLRALEGALGERTGQSYAAAIRRRLFLHMTRMPLSEMADRRAGAIALRFVGDLTAFKGWVARGVARLISACATIPAAFLTLYLLDPALAAVAAGPIGLVLGVILICGRPLGQAHATLRRKRARLAAAMAERLPQGIALRRAGRVKTELRALDGQSRDIVRAAVHRARLSESIRALPDAAAGVAGALCLWVCLTKGLSVADAVAALTALALVIWPLRHLADVRDRHQAYRVALSKLENALSSSRLPKTAKLSADGTAPAICIENLRLPNVAPIAFKVARGAMHRVSGPTGSGKSRLLHILAGLEAGPRDGSLQVFGRDPCALRAGEVLYLGPGAPMLKGSLRRVLTLGTAQKPTDAALTATLETIGLSGLLTRLGGLDGQVSEHAKNLTSSERTGLFLVRGLIARPSLALVDADELGFDVQALQLLLERFAKLRCAALVVTANNRLTTLQGPPVAMQSTLEANVSLREVA